MRGADIEAKDTPGYTALMYACNAGQLGAARLLINAGAEVDSCDLEGSAPLMFAAQDGHLDIAICDIKFLSSGPFFKRLF